MPPKFNLKVFSAAFILSLLVFASFAIIRSSLAKEVCANSLSCKNNLELIVSNDEQAVFNGKKFNVPYIDLNHIDDEERVLGAYTSGGEKHIYVDLTNQTLKAYEGNDLFLDTKISSGKWFPTPTGEFDIWYKVRSTKMEGGEGEDYYYLPNVPYVMFFENKEVAGWRGFSLHGAYWHNNFGHAMSHGCINMRITDAKKLYYWANPYTPEGKSAPSTAEAPGTKVTIYGKAL